MATQAAKPAYLQAKFTIGSCRGRMDYEMGERVFHPDDVAQEAKDARKWAQNYTRSTMLDVKPPFTRSTKTGKYVSATRPAPWDPNSKFEDRHYASQETQNRLQAELAYKQSLVYQRDDAEAINPKWNQSTVFDKRRAPPTDVYFSQANHRAADGSKSLRMGNERFVPAVTPVASGTKMITHTGDAKLGTGQPIITAFDPNEHNTKKKTTTTTRLSIDYKSLVERHNVEAQSMRKLKQQQRQTNVGKPRPASATCFDFPDVPNFQGTKLPDPEQIAQQINSTYTHDSLTKYLESMELSATTALQTRAMAKAVSR
jgi:hypothetical protein